MIYCRRSLVNSSSPQRRVHDLRNAAERPPKKKKKIQCERAVKNPLSANSQSRVFREEGDLRNIRRVASKRSPSSRIYYNSRIVSPLRGGIPRGSVIRSYKHNCALARDQPRAFGLNGYSTRALVV